MDSLNVLGPALLFPSIALLLYLTAALACARPPAGERQYVGRTEREEVWVGGALRVIVLDNLKEGVLLPDVYDPSVNPLYRGVLAHYGAVALLRSAPQLKPGTLARPEHAIELSDDEALVLFELLARHNEDSDPERCTSTTWPSGTRSGRSRQSSNAS